MPIERIVLRLAALATTLLASSAAFANEPLGVWVNDTGRGAIEIKDCGGKLCGHVVWTKDETDAHGCGRQIIGDLTSSGKGVWGGDDAWIYSPEKKKKYNVEVTPLEDGTLRVKGYAGISFLSKTMIWTKAPTDLARCSEQSAAAPAAPRSEPEAAPEGRAEAPRKKATRPAEEPDVADSDTESESGIDISELAEKYGDAFTMKDGKCKVNTPWVKLDFDCGGKE